MMARVMMVLALLVAWLRPADAGELVPMASRGRVHVVAERGLEADANRIAQQADAVLTEISADLVDLPIPSEIEIRLVRDSASLPEVAPAGRGAPPWAIGVAYPDLNIVSIALRRGAAVADSTTTLRHELGHIALGVALGDAAPHWLHEGFASQHAAEWSWERTETLAGMAWFGGIVPLNELDASFPAEELPANRAYAESYDFVGYLARRGRYEDTNDDGDRWPFRRFLTEIGHGTTPDAAAKVAFGRPLRELFDEWRSSLTDRYMLAPIGLLGLAVWIVCAILLVLGFRRRRRQNRVRMDAWEAQEAAEDAAVAAQIAALYAAPSPAPVPTARIVEPTDSTDTTLPPDHWLN